MYPKPHDGPGIGVADPIGALARQISRSSPSVAALTIDALRYPPSRAFSYHAGTHRKAWLERAAQVAMTWPAAAEGATARKRSGK